MTSQADIGEQKTVLIVEDHSLLRQVMREFLQSAFPACRFREAADGAGALEACTAYRPQLVLMDVCLPDANGIELTARLEILYPGIRVIIVSHRTGEVYVQQALAAGAWFVAGNGQVHHGRHDTKWKRYARARTGNRTG